MLFDLFSGTLTFQSAVAQVLAILIIIFLILPFHEWAHAFVAYKCGDTAIKYRGRLSLNPIEHIDLFGALCLLLVGFGWAKPVPVNTRNFRNPKRDIVLCALAGPMANIVAAFVGALILQTVYFFAYGFLITNVIGKILYSFLIYYIYVNIGLAVFNLIPVPPLDGSKILLNFLPYNALAWIDKNYQIIRIILIGVLFSGYLDRPINLLSDLIFNGILWFTGLPFDAISLIMGA